MKPQPVTNIDIAFPARGLELLPTWEDIPEDFQKQRHPLCSVVQKWFSPGLQRPRMVVKRGISHSMALRHLNVCMGSFAPMHEHKIAGVAWLISQWFDVFEDG